jgi:hypothetical protein
MADVAREPKIEAENNPWYLLATLHGDPSSGDDEVAVKNRVTWNRWIAPLIPDDLRASLIEAGRYSAEELTPLSEEERRDIQSKIGKDVPNEIDFSSLEFEKPFFAVGFIFPKSAHFASATFSDDAYFDTATFTDVARFDTATFTDVARFTSATFSGVADFDSATFSGTADFRSATFSGVANFTSATFSGLADFDTATFSGNAYFPMAAFSGDARFDNATFSGFAAFGSVTFSCNAIFPMAAFSGDAYFGNVIFSSNANFYGATLGKRAVFVNAEMRSQTDFDRVKFFEPPQLFGAKLHEGTRWHGVRWPKTPKDAVAAEDYVDAYERLKLEMDRLKKHGDELDFFALEQQSRRVLLGFWKGLPIAVYGFLCDYGRSYVRPLSLIGATVLVGAFLFAFHYVGFWTPIPGQAIGISFANTFGVLGIRKDLIDPSQIELLPGWLKVIATVQTGLGIVLLFLFGLAIRNRFRIK